MSSIKYTFVVPIYQRKEEVLELLESLYLSGFKSFEIILVDGSPDDDLSTVDKEILLKYSNLNYRRFHIPQLGISESRNLGAEKALGKYLIFLDSDIILPTNYLETVDMKLKIENIDAFGGPDTAHESFTTTQKAINYCMTSLLTTGGIRGRKSSVNKFRPRSFNFGIKKPVFDKLKGFDTAIKVGEDIDFSARIAEAGYHIALIPEAFVYHKRRVSIAKFYKQVFRFGAGRILLSKHHKKEMKVSYLFPLVFVLVVLSGIVWFFLSEFLFIFWLSGLSFYLLANFLLSSILNKSIKVGLLSIPTLFVQFYAYAKGFIINFISVHLLGREQGIFTETKEGSQSPL